MKTLIIRTTALLLLLIASISVSAAQRMTVKGQITEAKTGDPIIGCAIIAIIEGKTINAVASDVQGIYEIKVQKGAKLIFRYAGFENKTIVVTNSIHNVSLVLSETKLDEMVVTAHGVARKVSVVGAMAANSPFKKAQQEQYSKIEENRFKQVSKTPRSTFSIDVDTESYSNLRRAVNQGEMPVSDAVRTEELVNYFQYNYPQPTGDDIVSILTDAGSCPWNAKHRLVRIGLKAKEIPSDDLPASNLVFLIDVSGSMYGPTRLDLVKSSLRLLVNNLRQKDRVAIVVYAGAAGLVLPSTSGDKKREILDALSKLTAGGSTAGSQGVMLAYLTAKESFIKGGNNRVIICTDGDFNVGLSSSEQLEKLITQEREAGIYLTALGYGMGNYKSTTMQTLAEKGNGNHAYIDNLQEANKVLVGQFGSTLYTVAKDVKLQVEFNPSKVEAYRLLGYESRILQDEDFNNDAKDAGDMGPGHTVTALYEIVPVGAGSDYRGVDTLRYQKTKKANVTNNTSNEVLFVKLRYKSPENTKSQLFEKPFIDNGGENTSDDFRFASAVAMFGQLVRDSEFVKGRATYDDVIRLAKGARGDDPQGYRAEFIRLVEVVKQQKGRGLD